MGFRDIHAFNLAMLAKQARRLLTETHSLFYRVYKARYFPSCTFMEAELGTNPSFVWRSLLQAREVVREGSIWEVGDGRSIGVNTHKWLSRPPQFLVGVNTCLKVRDLISEETNKWNHNLLAATFTQSTVKEILWCKKGDLNSRDSLKWKKSKN
ncbi:putative mitochondrial protein AtMg00310 [Castanea sativa]|uniref:putative mitochondrial protein AtMg00310 n=1 Tax=Castanea sativa TaxID=21020 RepID=UPI003F64CF71